MREEESEPRAAQAAKKGRETFDSGKGTRGAHFEHVAHVHDAGRVEAQRLVEGRRGVEHVAQSVTLDVSKLSGWLNADA